MEQSTKLKLKRPKGTRDFNPKQMAIRQKCFNIIRNVFERHGAVEIDTPVFELRTTLAGKYGENQKLVYDLQDQGGELLSLRYDLTVPFARYMAQKNLRKIKRFHIAKVYRRDQPNVKHGRFREFYQCDFDIAGEYDLMMPDAESIKVFDEILTELDLGAFVIKLSSRKILDTMIEISESPKEKFNTICSSIDQLDKKKWDEIKQELIQKKQIPEKSVNVLGQYCNIKGSPNAILKQLKNDKLFTSSKQGSTALKEMELLFSYLESYGCIKNISFDLSLARGLDYYTGVIFEAVMNDYEVGSVVGGGRYDNLIGMFSSNQIPATGGSIGIERIFTAMQQKLEKLQQNQSSVIRENETEVLVSTIGPGLCMHKLQLCSELWKNNIKAELQNYEKTKPKDSLEYALKYMIPFAAFIGQDEIDNNTVTLKNLYRNQEEKIPRQSFIQHLNQEIKKLSQDLQEGKLYYPKQIKKEQEKEEDFNEEEEEGDEDHPEKQSG